MAARCVRRSWFRHDAIVDPGVSEFFHHLLQHRNEDTDSGAAPVRKSLEFQEITSMSNAPDVSEGCARVRRDVYAYRWNALFQRSGYAGSATVPVRPAR